MANSYVEIPVTGVDSYAFPFPYIEQSHITVYAGGVLQTQGVHYTFTDSNTIEFSVGNVPTDTATVILIKRVTDNDGRLVTYSNTGLDADDLNLGSKQNFFLAQEAIDASELNITKGVDGVTSVDGRLTNVEDPIDNQDAATKAYVASQIARSESAAVTLQATPPLAPSFGDLWVDTDTQVMSVYTPTGWANGGTVESETYNFTGSDLVVFGLYHIIPSASLGSADIDRVFLNGLLLQECTTTLDFTTGDWDRTSGVVTFENALAADDVITAVTTTRMSGVLADAIINVNTNLASILQLASSGSVVGITLKEQFISTAGQTVFNLINSYTQTQNNISVYVNGVRQTAYVESSDTSVTFINPLSQGDEVVFIINEKSVSGTVVDAANVTYTPAGTGAVVTTVQEKLRETVSVKDFGAVGDGVTDDTAAIQTALDSLAVGGELVVSVGTYVYSSDITSSLSDISVRCIGTLKALSESGANITFSGDRVKLYGNCIGNEQQTSVITGQSVGSSTLTVTDGVWSIGDQVIVRTTDSLKRVLWVGLVANVAGNTLTVSNNVIEGSFTNVTVGDSLELIKGLSTLHGQVVFEGCNDVYVEGYFNRDLQITNCNRVSLGDIRTSHAQVGVQFSRWVTLGSLISNDANFYGLTVQASADFSAGLVTVDNCGFSGVVLKGVHNSIFNSLNIKNAPIMAFQTVDYPNSIPSSINANLQGDLLNKNIVVNTLNVRECNWGLAIKSIDNLKIGSLYGYRNFKSDIYLDAAWSNVQLDQYISKEHNNTSANTATSGAAFWFQTGNGLTVGSINVEGAGSVSGKFCGYIDSVDDFQIKSISLKNVEQFIKINNCDDWSFDNYYSKDSVDGFQILTVEACNRWVINRLGCNENTNSTLDRFMMVTGSCSNGQVLSYNLSFDGTTASPTDGVRFNSTGSNLSVQSGIANNVSNVFRNTAACDHLHVSDIKGSSITNAVSVASVTNYLSISGVMGTIVDTTGALTNKFVGNNI
jgi:hypothetical protein